MKKTLFPVMAVLFIAAVVLLYHWGPAKQLFRTAEDRGIETGAYFYTELEQSYEAEAHIRGSLERSKWNSPAYILIAVLIAIAFITLTFWLGYKYFL
jgi:hypothetical protein